MVGNADCGWLGPEDDPQCLSPNTCVSEEGSEGIDVGGQHRTVPDG